MTKFNFPSGSIEFELYIASTMDVYQVKITSRYLKEPCETEITFDAFTKITEDVAKEVFYDTMVDLGFEFDEDGDRIPDGSEIEDYEPEEPPYHKWDMER